MAQVSVFRIDEYGYPRFTSAGFMSRQEAQELQATRYAGESTEILTYGEYKARQDPDSMPENELRKRQGLAPAPKRGVVVTGTIAGMTRQEVESGLRMAGYAPQSDLNGLTAFVLAGDKPGSKVARALAMGIPVKAASELGL